MRKFKMWRDKVDTLCARCHQGHISLGDVGVVCIYCDEMSETMKVPVRECTSFQDKSKPSKNEMERMAWILRTDKEGKAIGFVRPGDKNYKKARYDEDPR